MKFIRNLLLGLALLSFGVPAEAAYNGSVPSVVPSISALETLGAPSQYTPVMVSNFTPGGGGNEMFDWQSPCPGITTANGPFLASTRDGTGCWVSRQIPYGLQPDGQIYNNSNFTTLAGLLQPSGGSWSTSGGAIQTGTTGGVFTVSLEQNFYTQLPAWNQCATIKVGTINGGSIGIGLGTNSYTPGHQLDIISRVDLSTGGNGGHVDLWQGNGGGAVQIVASSGALSFSTNDIIQLCISYNNGLVNATATDLTTQAAAVTASYQFSEVYSGSSFQLPNRQRFALYNVGNVNEQIQSWNIYTPVQQNLDAICVGDSKTAGFYAGTYGDIFCNQVQPSLRTAIEAGGGDGTADILAIVPELLALHPKTVILNIGRNDIANGVGLATIEANYSSIVSQLQAGGITVYNLAPIYETTVDQTAFSAYISATYPGAFIDDANGTGLICQNQANPASNVTVADNIHPNLKCESIISTAILKFYNAVPLNTTYQSYNNFVSTTHLGPIFTGNAVFQPQSGAALPGYFFFGTNNAKTATSAVQVGLLGETTDSTPFVLGLSFTGGASDAARQFSFQTANFGSNNAGNITFQASGGSIQVGTIATSVNANQTYVFGCGQNNSQSGSGTARCGNLGQTNDASNPWALSVNFTQSNTPANRIFSLQTDQDGSANQGNLNLQPSGGNIGLCGVVGVPAAGLEVNCAAQFDSTIKNAGLIETAAAPTVAASQIGLGSTTTANTNCGTLAGSAGCMVINVAGTTRYVPFY